MDQRPTTLHPVHYKSLQFSQCSAIVDEMMAAPLLLADGAEAVWFNLGTFTAYNASSQSGVAFPTLADDTELWDSDSPPPNGLLPTASGSSGLDDDDDSGIGLNISVVESAARGTLPNAVTLSASSPLSSFSPSATKRTQRFFRLSTSNHINASAERSISQVNSYANSTSLQVFCQTTRCQI